MTADTQRIRDLARLLDKRDCAATERWLRKAQYGRFAAAASPLFAGLLAAEGALRRRAVRWESIENVLSGVLPNFNGLYNRTQELGRRDRVATTAWLRGAQFRRYARADDPQAAALTAAEKALKAGAVDWKSILKIFMEYLPVILPLFIK